MNPLRLLARIVLDAAYPPICIACREKSTRHHRLLLCEKCLTRAVLSAAHMCPRCGATMFREPTPGSPCPRCFNLHLTFERAISVGDYDGPLGVVVRALKFKRIRFLANPLGDELADSLAARMDVSQIDAVVAVPLHWSRRLSRGFNQSALIAKRLAKKLQLRNMPVLKRTRRTHQQMRLTAAQRRKNPLNAFAVRSGIDIAGKNVLLVDDVMTTGGTIMECARMLRKAGAKKIFVGVIAR